MEQKLHPNTVEFEVYGPRAIFTDPATKISGEKMSTQIPSHEALRGILRGIYAKPTITWYIDAVRVMNPIRYESEGILLPRFNNDKSDLARFTRLSNVRYQVRAHFEFNMHQTEMAQDRDPVKHLEIAKRMIEKGGRRDVYLGMRDCQAYVVPCVFGEGEGAYDKTGVIPFGLCYYGVTYSDEAYSPETEGYLTRHFYRPVMRDGIVFFPAPKDCDIHEPMMRQKVKVFPNINVRKGEPN